MGRQVVAELSARQTEVRVLARNPRRRFVFRKIVSLQSGDHKLLDARGFERGDIVGGEHASLLEQLLARTHRMGEDTAFGIRNSNRSEFHATRLGGGRIVRQTEDGAQAPIRPVLQPDRPAVPLGDRFYQDAREIRFVAPAEWVYRAVSFPMGSGPAVPGTKETGLLPPPNIIPFVPLRKASLEKSEIRN